ncbi:MAG: hypothetical protein QM723_07005 [Myxococcaceae bacterium]
MIPEFKVKDVVLWSLGFTLGMTLGVTIYGAVQAKIGGQNYHEV